MTVTNQQPTSQSDRANATANVSVLIPTKDDGKNLARCLNAIRGWADQIVVVDSQSADGTAELARSLGAEVVQFSYAGGWPKKRQWALDTLAWRNEWILLLDADEILTPEVRDAISTAIQDGNFDGYRLRFRIVFMKRMLRFGDTSLSKLSLFRSGRGKFERRLRDQDVSMGDMEVHEHVIVDGNVGTIAAPVCHENLNSIHHYIDKHNAYSTWEARVASAGEATELHPTPFGNQAQRRRWLKQLLLRLPGFPLAVFIYVYVFRLGFLDGRPGFFYAMFRAIQYMHIKAKIYEAVISARSPDEQRRRFHDRLAERWEAKYRKASFRAREDVLDRALAGIDLTGRRWLDAGCGSGRFSRALARRGCSVVGIDGSVQMIRVAKDESGASSRTEFQQLDILNIDQLGKFDGVLCNSVLEYLDQPEACVAACARCLHDNGMLLISVPNRRSLFRKILRFAHRVTGWPSYLRFSKNQYTRSQFAAILDRHGLSVHRTEFFGGPLPRWFQRSAGVGPLCMFVAYKRVIVA